MAEPLPLASAPPRDAVGKVLLRLTRVFAFSGGLVLLAITLMSVASIVGRALFAQPLTGDFELVQIGCAIAVAAFLPYCQMRRGHVLVDFFTTRAPRGVRAVLDAIGALALSLCAALVAWRMVLGASGLRESGESSMLLGVPTWYAYVPMIPAFALLALAGLYTAFAHMRERAR